MRSPCSSTSILRASHFSSSYVPVSQIVIVPAPYSPLGIVAVEVQVLQRMVLGVHGEAVLAGRVGQAVGHREGHQDAVVLEAQVPVQARGGVLLDDEAALVGWVGSGLAVAHRLGRAPGAALRAVGPELLAHGRIVSSVPMGTWRRIQRMLTSVARRQPCEERAPIEPDAFVPWIASRPSTEPVRTFG